MSVLFQKRKQKGRVVLESVHLVEAALLAGSAEENRPAGLAFAFQVGYQESGQDYVLYLLAPTEKDRTDWILALRTSKC